MNEGSWFYWQDGGVWHRGRRAPVNGHPDRWAFGRPYFRRTDRGTWERAGQLRHVAKTQPVWVQHLGLWVRITGDHAEIETRGR
jgi:hypothetical protein